MIQTTLFVVGLVACLVAGPAARLYAAAPVRLVVAITVDQLRSDGPDQLQPQPSVGGLGYLMAEGTHYTNAHFQHANTLTAPGHATLFTGAHAGAHGIAGNEWMDRDTGARIYCVEDDHHHILGREPVAHQGTSPRNLTASTIGDELVAATGGRSRVFSVSRKDRGAILPGGHLGKAFWYDTPTGDMVTSTYYYGESPDWVDAFNQVGARSYRDSVWTLRRDGSRYVGADDRRGEHGATATFPHELAGLDDGAFYKELRYTPFGDDLIVDFAIAALEAEGLGRGTDTDMLCVSLSATDAIGHRYGPRSWEAQDNLLRLDASIGRLLRHVEATVGLHNTLVVLSSDHGADDNPEHRADAGQPAGRLDMSAFIAAADARLRDELDCDRPLVDAFHSPALFLDHAGVRECGLDPAQVEVLLAREAERLEEVAFALTRTQLLTGAYLHTPLHDRVRRAFHPHRSGDVLVVQQPFWYMHADIGEHAAMHGSPYNYDSHVPILLAGPGIAARRVARPVAPSDIAVTLALYLGVGIPSASAGTPLSEIID